MISTINKTKIKNNSKAKTRYIRTGTKKKYIKNFSSVKKNAQNHANHAPSIFLFI